jgi:hypothetical protein
MDKLGYTGSWFWWIGKVTYHIITLLGNLFTCLVLGCRCWLYSIPNTHTPSPCLTPPIPSQSSTLLCSAVSSPTMMNFSPHTVMPTLALPLTMRVAVYTLEKMLAQWRCGRGWQYLVKWVGYDDEENSWLPCREVEDCVALADWFISQG